MSEVAPTGASISRASGGGRQVGAYALLVVLPVVLTAGVLRYGASLPAVNAVVVGGTPPMVPAAMAVLRPALLLAQLVAIIVVSRLTGRLFVRFGQPRVVGEMIAGVLLGPSVLGLAAPHVYELLFPRGSVRFLSALSQVGLMLFMFLVGLELHPRAIRQQGRTVILTAHAGIAVPFCLGTTTALLRSKAGGTRRSRASRWRVRP